MKISVPSCVSKVNQDEHTRRNHTTERCQDCMQDGSSDHQTEGREGLPNPAKEKLTMIGARSMMQIVSLEPDCHGVGRVSPASKCFTAQTSWSTFQSRDWHGCSLSQFTILLVRVLKLFANTD